MSHICMEAHHGPDQPAGEICPFCARPKHMEPATAVRCFMCDMEIPHPDVASSIDAGSGETLYFCSIWCFRIYMREETAAARIGWYLPFGQPPENTG
jgi:hypothetical protein